MVDAEPAVEGEIELAEADLAAVMPHLPELKRSWALPILTVCWVPVALLMRRDTNFVGLLPVILPALFVGAVFGYFQLALRKKWPKLALTNLGGGRTTFRFDDFGFSSSSSSRQHRLAYGALSRYVETPESFVIYTTPRTLLVVPKRAFSAEQIARARELLKARIVFEPTALKQQAMLKRTLLLWLALIVVFGTVWLLLNDGSAADGGAPPAERELPSGK